MASRFLRLIRHVTASELAALRKATARAAEVNRMMPFKQALHLRGPHGRFITMGAPGPAGQAISGVERAAGAVQRVAPGLPHAPGLGRHLLPERARRVLRATLKGFEQDHLPNFSTQEQADAFVRRMSIFGRLERRIKDTKLPEHHRLRAIKQKQAIESFGTQEGYTRTQRALRSRNLEADLAHEDLISGSKTGAKAPRAGVGKALQRGEPPAKLGTTPTHKYYSPEPGKVEPVPHEIAGMDSALDRKSVV